MYKCYLYINNESLDVTNDVRNWDDIEASFKREGYGGVMRSFTNKFEFVGDARERIMSHFDENYLSSSARITIKTTDDELKYVARFSCDLDFTTLEDDLLTVSINAVDNDIASIIKAKKSTEYEYPVSSLKDSKSLYYDGIEVTESVTWQPQSNVGGGGEEADRVTVEFGRDKYFPLYILNEEVGVGTAFEYYDQIGTSEGVLKAKKDIDIQVEININAILYVKPTYEGKTSYGISLRIGSRSFEMRVDSNTPELVNAHRVFDVKLNADDHLFIYAGSIVPDASTSGATYVTYDLMTTSYVKVTCKNRITPINIDLVSPNVLLNNLLKSMNGGKDGITGEIASSERISKAMLCAAESIRGIPEAKIYSSFSKFCDWMESVFGYVYEIKNNRVIFVHRNTCFSGEVVRGVYDWSDYKISLLSNLIYSRVLVGYDRQDYEGTNGRDEFNFTNQYTTGVLNTENELNLISPYRGDSFGIEFLAEERGKDTTDNSSDKDLFFVGVIKGDDKYTVDRSFSIEGVVSPETMFNAMFSPSSFIEANKGYIGACTEKLSFASSDGNANVVISGNKGNRDITISESLFKAKEVEFETSDMDIPPNLNGMIELRLGGETIQGYIMNIDYQYTKKKSSKIKMITK